MIEILLKLLPPLLTPTKGDSHCWWCNAKFEKLDAPFPWPHNPHEYLTELTYECGSRFRIKDLETYAWIVVCVKDPAVTQDILNKYTKVRGNVTAGDVLPVNDAPDVYPYQSYSLESFQCQHDKGFHLDLDRKLATCASCEQTVPATLTQEQIEKIQAGMPAGVASRKALSESTQQAHLIVDENNDANVFGPHVFGTYQGKPVVRVPYDPLLEKEIRQDVGIQGRFPSPYSPLFATHKQDECKHTQIYFNKPYKCVACDAIVELK